MFLNGSSVLSVTYGHSEFVEATLLNQLIGEQKECDTRTSTSCIKSIADNGIVNLLLSLIFNIKRGDRSKETVITLNGLFKNGVELMDRFISDFKSDEYHFYLANAITLDFSYEDGYYSACYEPLGIDVYSMNKNELYDFFCEEFLFLWKSYALEDDSKLTYEAINLKNKLKNMIKEVKVDGNNKSKRN